MAERTARPEKSASDKLKDAGKRALGGGVAGAAAMVCQVFTLMPLRTTMNYQYRYGEKMTKVISTLYTEGGIRRFYRGLGPALIQGPLSRFGDTAANMGALALLGSIDSTADLPMAVKTIGASLTAGIFRIALVPVDTVKTIMQVEGASGMAKLRGKIALHGPGALFHGALATWAATTAGHYPWFATFNTLQEMVPKAAPEDTVGKLSRNAGIGFASTMVSDTISNSLRVIKTFRQTSEVPVSYPHAVRTIVAKDGIGGLLWRGLKTRLLANGLQGLMFSVLWKAFEELLFPGNNSSNGSSSNGASSNGRSGSGNGASSANNSSSGASGSGITATAAHAIVLPAGTSTTSGSGSTSTGGGVGAA